MSQTKLAGDARRLLKPGLPVGLTNPWYLKNKNMFWMFSYAIVTFNQLFSLSTEMAVAGAGCSVPSALWLRW